MNQPNHIAITGASSGLGAALAAIYATPGIQLSLHGRDADRLVKTAESARRVGATVTTTTGDVQDEEHMRLWIQGCESVRPIDLLIANAGISAGSGPAGLESITQSLAIFQTNIMGVLHTLHPLIPYMVQRRRGQIAIMSSLAGFRGLPGAASYAGSKAAVRVYGESLRLSLRPLGIAVNVICPGFVSTPMTDANPFPMPFLMTAERAASLIQKELRRDKARIAFPWPVKLMVALTTMLPIAWTDPLLAHLPRKPPLQ